MRAGTEAALLTDPINARILAVSEDRLVGFMADPLHEVARRTGLPLGVVIERIGAMLRAGTIRRVRQTLIATSLARGCLVAWQVPESGLHAAFDFLFEQDPFSGHVVIRSTDPATPGSQYRLWTTLKVPQGYSLEKHCAWLAGQIGAESYRLMPARKLFVLGVGHVRRRNVEPGQKSEGLAEPMDTAPVRLSDEQWRVLLALKREFTAEELDNARGEGCGSLWSERAAEAGVTLESFLGTARDLSNRGLLGRFSTFLEHVKPLADGQRVTRFNGLFHWAVPAGREIEAGRQVGRFLILTHAYWREAGAEFNNVNLMAVAHGSDKGLLLAHKRAIDEHLESLGVPVLYTNTFWGGRSEIKPSEVSPIAYERFCRERGIAPQAMRE